MGNKLQLGVDIGRVIALTEYGKSPEALQAAAQGIVNWLNIEIAEDEEAQFILGLGWGCADRRKVPVEEEVGKILA